MQSRRFGALLLSLLDNGIKIEENMVIRDPFLNTTGWNDPRQSRVQFNDFGQKEIRRMRGKLGTQ
jgi:hypothetical protein